MNWREAYKNFDLMEPLESGDQRLQPELFGKFLDDVACLLSLNRGKKQKLLLSGHVGCGKSTFLNLLKEHQTIKQEFFPVKYSIKEIIDPSDADHIDLLLSIGIQSILATYEQKVSLKKELLEKLQEYADELKGLISREEERVKRRKGAIGVEVNLASLILWLKDVFLARYRVETETRKRVRKYYRPKMHDFLNIINDVLSRIQLSLEDKSLLILVDDTDKIPPEKALGIFHDSGQYLSEPISNIVFMVDTSLSCSTKYPVIRGKIGNEEFFPAIKIVERDGSSSEATKQNYELLRQLVLKRISQELIDDQALDEAILMSGGVVRELIRIINEAIFAAKGKVRKEHIDYAVIRIRNSYNLFGDHVKILKAIVDQPNWLQISMENIAELEPLFLELLHMPALFQYRDGEDKWYRPYPILISWLNRQKL